MAAPAAAAVPAANPQAVVAAPAIAPLGAVLQHVEGLPPPDLTMPALEPVKNRETYRTRPDDELEEATWYSAEEPDALVEPTKIRLRSIHSKQATVISFANKSTFRVRALWIDFNGHEVVYSVLEPNTTRRYHTYSTHPWIVRELCSGTRMLLSGRPTVVGMSADQTVEISAPPRLDWSLDTHRCFPEPYKTSIRGLIQAHKQLEPHAGSSAAAAASHAPVTPLSVAASSPGGSDVAVPCSPRATLLQQGHAAALPTSPKARRLSMSPGLPPPSPRAAAPDGCCTTPRTPRAASPGDVSTTISISSEAAHFTATLTVSSPTRAMLKQTLNIEVFNSSVPRGGSSSGSSSASLGGARLQLPAVAEAPAAGCTCDIGSSDSMLVDDQGQTRSVMPSTSTKKAHRSRQGLFGNLVHSVKSAFRSSGSKQRSRSSSSSSPTAIDAAAPAAAPTTTTHIKVHLQQQLQDDTAAGADCMDVDDVAAAVPCCFGSRAQWPPVGTHLGDLPNHLLAHIAELAAPVTWQTMEQCPAGRPAIHPTLLACPPEDQQQQQQQEEEDEEEGAAVDDADNALPALI